MMLSDSSKYLIFEAVKMQFVNYIQLAATKKETPKTRTVTTVRHGQGRNGSTHSTDARYGHGCTKDYEAARKHGLPPQAEVDECTHITKTFYPHKECRKSGS